MKIAKKASMELSVNFLVVMIICLALLGIGIFLMTSFIGISTKLPKSVDAQQKAMLEQALNEGALVAAFPSIATVDRGSPADFGIGISNELGQKNSFSISVGDGKCNPTMPVLEDFKKLYIAGPYSIENKAYRDVPVRIIVPRSAQKGTCVFTVYVCKTDSCSESSPIADRYGDLQTLQVNVK
jgi:hypothetical protein